MSASIVPGLSIIHANQMEPLRTLLVEWVRAHPLGPLENEIFLVQSNGMAQWLKLALASEQGLGIAAAMEMQLPSRFLWQSYRAVLGEQAVPKDSPYDKPQLRWRLMKLLPQLLTQPVFAPLKQFLRDDGDCRKLDQLAEQLADLFDQYQVYRADWLDGWARGDDTLLSASGEVSDIDAPQAWQPALWRAVVNDMTPQWRDSSRARLHQSFIDALEQAPQRPAALPRRVLVFGISALPQQAVESLKALAKHCQILLCVQNPCQHFWADIVEDRELLRRELARARHSRKPGAPAVIDLESMHQHANPLLASWGKQGRDYIGLLYGIDEPEQYRDYFRTIDLWQSPLPETSAPSLLNRIQQGIFDLEPMPSSPQPLAIEDRSVVFHLAHSRQREVEVLHDQLLQRFNDQADLSPSDIIVMMPDVDLYAPHIEAVFGHLDWDDPRHIPFTIADRPERGHQVVVLALEKLLHLSQSRFAVSELLELLAVPALRARFGIDESQLPLLARWVEQAGVRWGLDGQQRQSFQLPGQLEQNTWRFGLKRMLLGYAVGQGENWHGIEPLDEVGGLDAALVGKVCQLIDALADLWQHLGQSHTPAQWNQLLRSAVAALFLPQDEQETLLLERMQDALAQWLSACDDAGLEQELPITVVREVALAPFGDEGVSQRFLAGKVNFCTLMPMRAIPFQQVCLLGMNDGDYPRSRPPLDFDMMARPGQYRPGDRSRREDDRYLFLEALLAARQQLYISYIGRNVRDNSERTPSVLVGQLQDYLCSAFSLADQDVLAALTTIHPLQPYAPAYFDGQHSALFSYASEWQQVHHQPSASATDPDARLAALCRDEPLMLSELQGLLADPVRSFMNQRLGVWFVQEMSVSEDLEPFALDGLQRYLLRDELLQQLYLSNPDQARDALEITVSKLVRRGQLPMKGFAALASQDLAEPAWQAYQHYQHCLQGLTPTEASLELRHSHKELVLEDWLTGLYQDAEGHWVQLQVRPGNLGGKSGLKNPLHLNRLYCGHLAASACDHPITSVLIGSDGVWQLAPMPAQQARERLQLLMSLYADAMRQPLPVAPRAAFAYLAADGDHHDRLQQAQSAYEPGFFGGGDLGYSPYLARQYPDFSRLDGDRFAVLAEALYQPLLDLVEQVEV
ncbi:exodeoxyribonuclease V subunit gamma [Ferrimonas sp. SCSIO 43195]|uniref:exodeoxyribonuclease V subunit gamma n=1 Tax=Ferrimonas sp. SCSIO 43195 TaxID=2822844 RepID=UPI0020751C29|nr:exodeoxyribonuclease V subunit gamma [Ferrimonas sp. SCSIO 43195]USD36020.1 exodeoxyribonuclease V subunit gamma [Ferrimonas sp. SCSIO 43195]